MPRPLPRPPRPIWQRTLWCAAGVLALVAGAVGIVLPLLPTVPFVLLAAFCFSRGSTRLEAWLLAHRHLGPPIRNWRSHRAMPLRAKQLAWLMMSISCVAAALLLPPHWAAVPVLCCAAVAYWMWRLPTTVPPPPPA